MESGIFLNKDLKSQGRVGSIDDKVRKSTEIEDSFLAIISTRDSCNLACKYCFVKDERKRVMDDGTLKRVITEFMKFFSSRESSVIEFLFHGPEVTQDLGYLKKAVQIQREYYNSLRTDRPLYLEDCLEGEKPFILNTVQTNATLIKPDLAKLLKNCGIKRLSISLDGPQDIHDANRVYHNGSGSFSDIMRSIEAARKEDIDAGAVAVFTGKSVGRVEEIYRFFNENKISFRLNPLIANSSCPKDILITATEYSQALKELTDLYLADPEDKIRIITIDQFLKIILSDNLSFNDEKKQSHPFDLYGLADIFAVTCQGFLCSIDPVGDVYPCESLMSSREFCYGNINGGLKKVFNSQTRVKVLERVYDLSSDCQGCDVFQICFGGCPSAAYQANGSIYSKDPFCETYQEMFRHVKDIIKTYLIKNEGTDLPIPMS